MAWDNRLSFDNPHLFLDLLQMRKDKQKDSIILVTGERRSFKSLGSIRIAETLDKDFDVTKNLFFNVKDFLIRWSNLDGGVIILDEASENVDRRQWFSIENRVFNSLITREGFRRNIAILTFPMISDLDSRSVRLCTFHMTMKGYDSERGNAFALVYRLKSVSLLGKSYPAFVQALPIQLPSKKNLEAYMEMKLKWNKEKSQENIDTIEMLENPESYGKKFPYSFYVNAYKKGVIPSTEELKDNLIQLGFKAKDIELMIKSQNKIIDEKNGSILTRI
jgi:hypothetical protein